MSLHNRVLWEYQMSNEQNSQGISISVSNEAVQQISNVVLEWRKVQSYDLKLAIEMIERLADKGLGAILAVEAARQARISRLDAAISRGPKEADEEGTEV